MEFIPEAVNIVEHCRKGELVLRQKLELFVQVCHAVQHAHSNRVIHCDLKPGNILVEEGSGFRVQGSAGHRSSSSLNPEPRTLNPKIIDFGIARVLETDPAAVTRTLTAGGLAGTVQYMSPEQCRGDGRDVDARADVYALGVVLYEMLCGQPPYQVRELPLHQAVGVVCDRQPDRPSSIQAMLRGDLETILLKALAKEPSKRYQTADELAADILRYLNRQPISARPPSLRYQVMMLASRHKPLFAVSAVSLTLLIAAITVILVLHSAAQRSAREDAELDARWSAIPFATGDDVTIGVSPKGSMSLPLLRGRLTDDEVTSRGGRYIAIIHDVASGGGGALVLFDDEAQEVQRLRVNFAEEVPYGVPESHPVQPDCGLHRPIFEDLLPDHPGREIAITLSGSGHASVVRIYNRELRLLGELWNRGGFTSMMWDAASEFLILTCDSLRLPYYLPEAVFYDSADCPDGRVEAQLAFAIRPENLHGVLFPTPSDPDHPYAQVEWAMVREPVEALGPDREFWGQRIYAVPPDADRPDAVAKLMAPFGEFARPKWPATLTFVHVDAAGYQLDVPRITSDERRMPPLKFSPFDLNRLAVAVPVAEEAMLAGGILAEVQESLRRRKDVDAETLDDALRVADAMSANWRWLRNSAEDNPAACAKALIWATDAVRIHDSRCPDPQGCSARWYALSALGIAQYRAGQYEDAISTFNDSIALIPVAFHNPKEFPHNRVLDYSYLAMAYARLDRPEKAEESLQKVIEFWQAYDKNTPNEADSAFKEGWRRVRGSDEGLSELVEWRDSLAN